MPDVVPSLCFFKLYILYYIVLVIAVVYLTAWVSKWAALPHHSPGHDPGGTELCGQLCQWPWPHLLLRQPHPVHSIRYDHAHLSHELAGMFWLLLDWNRRNVHIFVVSRSLADQTILSISVTVLCYWYRLVWRWGTLTPYRRGRTSSGCPSR